MTIAQKQPGPGRPPDLGKRSAILEAAKRLFVERGFDNTSMDAVAQVAGVSKLTVYNHFKDKESLFAAAVAAKCEEQLPPEYFSDEAGPDTGRRRRPIRERLLAIARGFRALITSPEAVAVHRMMAAEARSTGKLGDLFYEAGPKRTLIEFEGFLRAAIDARELEIDDPARAAEHFLCMLKGVGHMRMLCGCEVHENPADAERHIESVVSLFLRAFAPRAG